MARAAGLALLLALVAACDGAGRTTAQLARAEALERARRLTRALEVFESELQSEGIELAVNAELRRRHGRVSEVACRVSSNHLRDIRRLAAIQEQRLAARGKRPR